MLSSLTNDQFLTLFAKELKRRGCLGLVCAIPLDGSDSFFVGAYPEQWADLAGMTLCEQLQYLAAYASITKESERTRVDDEPILSDRRVM